MNDDMTLRVRLMATTNEYVAGLGRAATSTRAFASQSANFVQQHERSFTRAGMVVAAFGAATLLAMRKAGNATNELNASMANVATLIPNSTERVYQLRSSVQELAIATAKSTDDISGGLYQVISAFGDTADTVDILRINAEAARAGLAQTEEAIALTSAVTKGYGDTTKEAVQHASDLAFTTVRLGQTTFPELAASIGGVVPLAAALNVTQEELFGTMATFTGVTGNAATVATQMTSALTAMLNPSEELEDLMTRLGFASGDAMMANMGLQGSIQAIADEADATGTPIMAFLRRKEAVTFALAATGGQADVWTEKLEEMGVASGASAEALREQTEGINRWGFTAEQAAIKQEVAWQKLGESVAPIMGRISESVGNMADRFLELEPQTRGVAAGFGMVTGAAMLLAGTLLFLAPRIVATKLALADLGVTAAATRGGMAGLARFLIGPWGMALGGAAAVLASFSRNTREAEQVTGFLRTELGGAAAEAEHLSDEWLRGELRQRDALRAASALGVSLEDLRRAIIGPKEEYRELTDRIGEGDEAFWHLLESVPLVSTEKGRLLRTITELRKGTADYNAELEAEAELLRERHAIDTLLGGATGWLDRVRESATAAQELREAAAEAGVDIDALTEGTDEAASAFDDLAPSIEAAFASLAAGFDPMKQYQDNLAELNEANRKAAEETGKTTTDMAASWSAYMSALDQTLQDQRAWHANLNTIREAAGDDYADLLAAQGPEYAGLHAEIAKQEHSEIQAAADRALAIRDEAIEEGVSRLIRSRPEWVDAAGVVSDAAVEEIAEKLGVTPTVVQGIMADSTAVLEAQFRAMKEASGSGAASTVAAMAFELGKGTAEADRIVNAWANATGQNLNPLLMAVGKSEIPMFARKLFAGAESGGLPIGESGGGIADISTPPVPSFAPLGYPISTTGKGAIEHTRDAVQDWVGSQAPSPGDPAAPGGPGGLAPPGGGSTIQRLIQMASGVPNRVTSTFRPNSKTYHGLRRAVDFADPAGPRPRGSPAMMAIFNQLLRFGSSLKELFYTPAGFSIKNGRRTRPIAASTHYNHVHAAMMNGGTITEPIFGVGTSGNTYSFGEAGPEQVVPLTGGMPAVPTFAGSSARLDPDEYRRRVEINNRLFELGIIKLTAHLENLERRMMRTVPFSAEWMEIFNERKRLVDGLLEDHLRSVEDAQRRQDDALGRLNSLLDERNQITERRNDELRRIEERFDAERERILRDRERSLFEAFRPEQRVARQWANSIQAVTRNLADQLASREAWGAGLDRLRSMGLSEEAIEALGLDQLTAESLATVQLWSNSTAAEVDALNEAVVASHEWAADRAEHEATRNLGAVGEALIALTQDTADETARIYREHSDAMAAVGVDQGRSWAEAIAEGIDSGIPSILAAVERANAARMLTLREQAQLDGARAIAEANPAAGQSATIAPLGHHYVLPTGQHALRLSNRSWYVATGPGQRDELQRLYGPPTPHPDIQGDRIIGSLVSLFGAGGLEKFTGAQIQPRYFDKGGWLPPNSTGTWVNATSTWEPVGQNTHAVSAVAAQDRVVRAIQEQTRVIERGIERGQVVTLPRGTMDGIADYTQSKLAEQGDVARLQQRRGRAGVR